MADNEYSLPNILYNRNHYTDEQWERIQRWIKAKKRWYLPTVHFATRADSHQPYGWLARAYNRWLDR